MGTNRHVHVHVYVHVHQMLLNRLSLSLQYDTAFIRRWPTGQQSGLQSGVGPTLVHPAVTKSHANSIFVQSEDTLCWHLDQACEYV